MGFTFFGKKEETAGAAGQKAGLGKKSSSRVAVYLAQ